MNLVTDAEARAHIRIDNDADDVWLDIMIPAISGAVASWLKDSWRLYVPSVDTNGDELLDSNGDPIPAIDTDGDMIVLPIVKAAVLVELGQQYRFRDGSGASSVESHNGYGYILGQGATSLLFGLRKSTVK